MEVDNAEAVAVEMALGGNKQCAACGRWSDDAHDMKWLSKTDAYEVNTIVCNPCHQDVWMPVYESTDGISSPGNYGPGNVGYETFKRWLNSQRTKNGLPPLKPS